MPPHFRSLVTGLSADRLLFGFILVLWGSAAFFPPLNADAAAMLRFAERMLDGEALYRDLIDFNPPMGYWLDLLPAGLAKAGLGSAVFWFVALCLIIIAGGAALAFRIIAPLLNDTERRLLALVGAITLLVRPADSFGEREHLMVALILPYGALAVRALVGSPDASRVLRVFATTIAFIGIAQKPQFALLGAVVEVLLLVRLSPRLWLKRPEPWLFLGLGGAYVGATAALYPAYFADMLPLAAAHYDIFDLDQGIDMITGVELPPLLIGTACLAPWALRARARPVATVLWLLTLGAILAGLLQFKDWDYHFLPARILLILLSAYGLAGLLSRLESPATGRILALFAIALMALGGHLSPPLRLQLDYRKSDARVVEGLIRAEGGGRPVLWLTQYIDPTAPVLNYTGNRLAMPFMSLWLLPALYEADTPGADGRLRLHPPEARSPAETLLLTRVAEAVQREKPSLILAEPSQDEAAFRLRPLDYLEFFSQDPRFSEEFTHYRLLKRIGTLRVYKRED